MFVELAARTHFSFLRGGSSPRALIEHAARLGYDAIGVADCDGLYGIVRALEAADELGVRLVVGCEVAIDGEGPASLWLHVENATGYRNLCRILTDSHARHPKGKARREDEGVPRNQFAGIPLDQICACAEGLWCLVPVVPSSGWGVSGGSVRAPPEVQGSQSCAERSRASASETRRSDAHVPRAVIQTLKNSFGERLSIAAWRHLDGEDDVRIAQVEQLSRETGVAVCATNRVLFAEPGDKPVLDVLHCIREGVTLDEAGRALLPNAEAHLRSREAMVALFADHPDWLARSRAVADACRFSMRELKYRFPCELDAPAFPGETPDEALRRLTAEGARKRWPGGVKPVTAAQIEKELRMIAELQVAPYFLSVQTIVDIARSKDILCQGRGSAANSAVCYCLGITAVDPARSNLLFERFLSLERREPPDIDVDFEHERREEVIQAIYVKYGRARAAMVSEIISYRGKSALREVGKVFGLSLEQVDRLGDLVSWWDKLDALQPARVRECGFDPGDPRVAQVLGMAFAIQGFPRHLSIHVGGFVLSAEDLVNVAPVEPATMKDRTVIPWDKDDLDTLGFFKVDVLGLGMLTAIRKALDLAMPAEQFNSQTAIDRLARIPAEDPLVYDALCAADTVGVFQIESRAQMAMLPRLRPRKFYDLVVEVAIVRPGPIQGGMVHPYLRRRNNEEPADLPHPSLGPILTRTLGVPLFQEQVMQIAIVGAGYTGGEADQLRRDMAAWRRNGKLARHRDKLLAGFERTGISQEMGERLYQSIQGFAEYGFPESHAASFALLVYASSWLKVHHPAAFAAALVNSQPMGFYSPGTLVKDAERHGVDVLPVRVDASDWDCTLEGDDPGLRLGLRLIKGLGQEAGRRIEQARRARAFASVEDMVGRAGLDKREVEALAHAGALVGFGLGRREAMWKVRAPRLHPPGPPPRKQGGGGVRGGASAQDLFSGIELGDELPELPPLSRAEQLVLDYETTGVAVKDHAMNVVRPRLPAHYKSARDLNAVPHGTRVSTAGMVICRQRPGTASGVVFVTMEDETGFVNLILWARTFEKMRHVATTSSMLVAHGKVERQGDVIYVVPDRLEPLHLMEVPGMSRDFH